MLFIIISQILVFTSKFTAFLSPVKNKKQTWCFLPPLVSLPDEIYLLFMLFPKLLSHTYICTVGFETCTKSFSFQLRMYKASLSSIISFFLLWNKYFAFFPNTSNFFIDSQMYRGFLLPPQRMYGIFEQFTLEKNLMFCFCCIRFICSVFVPLPLLSPSSIHCIRELRYDHLKIPKKIFSCCIYVLSK